MLAANSHTRPFRLALGSMAYASIREALCKREKELEAQKAVTLSVDRDM